MKKTNYIFLIGAFVLVMSCGESKDSIKEVVSTTVATQESSTVTERTWEYDHGSTTVKWTGFKLASKAGVSGEFDSINVVGFNPDSDLATAMTGVKFEIYTQSINSNDSVRDWKLANVLFGKMNTDLITGEIKEINEGEESALISIVMGGASMDVPMSFSIGDDNVVKLSGTIDLPTWGESVNSGFIAISEACAEKHENKTWPDVDIKVFTKLKRVE